MNAFGLIVLIIAVAASVACSAIARSVGKPPRSRVHLAQSIVLGTLTALAPIALVLFLRLSIRACVVLNVLGLPWVDPWREIVQWGSGVVWLASAVFLIFALVRPNLRPAGIAMLIWSAASVLPAFFFYFLSVYGDPAVGCIPL